MVFRNVSFFGEVTERKQIRENIIWYLKEQLLNIGAYYNITSGFLDYGDNDLSKLRPSYQPEYNNFQFWAGQSHQWIWESGITPYYSGAVDPINISGVYINDIYTPISSTGNYQHYVDYNRGGIVFNSGLGSGTQVRCYRSERAAFVYPSDSNELRQINLQYLRNFQNIPGSGLDSTSPEYKTFLPAIFVDISLDNTIPFELGSITQFKRYRIVFDIISEDLDRFDVLRDICVNLEAISISMFNVNDVISASGYPLDYLGRKTAYTKIRSQLNTISPWRNGRFLEKVKDVQFPNLFPLKHGRVFLDFELVL